MTSSQTPVPFRFLDLPREIRDSIYRLSLCTFGSRPDTIRPPSDLNANPGWTNELAVLEHAIDTSILLASKQIHREAYDAMVKQNRFVRVTTSGGLPLRLLLNHLRVPVVTENEESVENFKGYVLSVSLTCPEEIGDVYRDTPFSIEPCSLMLLGREMDVFCDILMDGYTTLPGFGNKTSLEIELAPGSILVPSSYKSTMTEFFSEATQRALLQPFRNRLRGFKKTEVRGLVSRTIAEAVETEMASDVATDPDAVLSQYEDLKNEGSSLYRSKQADAACLKWMDATLEIEQLPQSSSWSELTEKGGVAFVSRLAELYFLMKLNAIHVKLIAMEKGEPYADIMVEDSIEMARSSLKTGFWMPEFRWRPTDAHKAKFHYRHALFLRLRGDPRTINLAVVLIDHAHRLLPGDAGILRERSLIAAWKAAMS